jgi:N-acetylmuramoyl-L-alanine amidase
MVKAKILKLLDAGHGAHDFGASYNGHVEKT